MLPLLIGAVSAGSALAGDIIERNAAKKAKQDAINAYTKLLIPTSETEARADRAGDTLYTKAMSELNSGAFAARGALNPETLKTIAYTKMAGARAETEFQVGEEDYKYNKGIQQQIAQIEAQPTPTINPLNAIEAGVGGYLAGSQLEMAQNLNDQYASLAQAQTDYFNRGSKNKVSNNSFGFGVNRLDDFTTPNLSINGKVNNVLIPSLSKPDVIPGMLDEVTVTGKSGWKGNQTTPIEPFKGLDFGMSTVETPQKYDYEGNAIGRSKSGRMADFSNGIEALDWYYNKRKKK